MTWPVPVKHAWFPVTTSESKAVLWNRKSAAGNWNTRLPVGTEPFVLLIVNPKVAFPVSDGSAVRAPAGELIHPPPVTEALPGVGVTVAVGVGVGVTTNGVGVLVGVFVGVVVGVFVGVFVGVTVGEFVGVFDGVGVGVSVGVLVGVFVGVSVGV